eukprot:gene19869-23583_t
MTDQDYFTQSPTHAETSINDIVQEGHEDAEALLDEKVGGVKRALLQSPEKEPKAKKAKPTTSPKKAKSPKKSAKSTTSSSSKKSTPKTPKSGAKSASKTSSSKPTSTAAKKKKLAALEAQEEEHKQALEKLRREKTKQQAKLAKLEESQGPVCVAPKLTTMDIFNGSASVLDAFSRAENFFPTEAVDDAITVWNFLNTF